MDTFMVDQLKLRWPPDWTKLHVYFVPDPVEIKPLIDAYGSIVDDFDFVSRQPDEWLHSTIMVVDGIPARDVTVQQRTEFKERLRQVLIELPSFAVTCGPAIVRRSSIALEMVPDRDFAELVDRVKTAAGDVFGWEAVQYSSGRPHITLGYATGDGDSGIIQSRLRDVTDLHVTLMVDNVRLVDVRVDTELCQFRWEELAVLRMKG
ncbi:2'-5' RNA ligase family protein [Nocardia sp. NPDC052566]|uniref:2'-5' RNA ligase family protein n=1 Tax=Nocardia sp. NPDC052566 TaxID=3364330 RepID=UPI0037C55C08